MLCRCRAELKSTFEEQASLVTNEGITVASKVQGSVFFTTSSAPLPISDGDLPAPKVDGSVSNVPPNPEEARLLKHVKKPSMGFKSNPSVQPTVKPAEVPISTIEVSAAAGSAGTKPATRDEAEEARLMKHVHAKASKAVQSGSQSLFLAAQGAPVKGPLVTKVATPPGTPTENASPPIPTWKVKQIERENQERAKREQERAKLAALNQTVSETSSGGTNSSGANSNVNTETAGASVNVNGTGTVGSSDEGVVKSSIFGSTVDPENDERLKKEEERLMKLMAGKSKGIKY